MLRATRRHLRPAGRTAFYVIHLPLDLPPDARGRAVAVGPSAVATRSPSYRHLLTSAGFVAIEQVDVTERYQEVQRRWLQVALAMRDELAAIEPPGSFDERLAEQAATRVALDEGLLQRSLFVARRRPA